MNDGGRQSVIDTIATPQNGSPFRRVLNPVDRAAEILFGLIMVMTFIGSLGVAHAGSADIKAMIIGALSCNLAWGIIDAVMFLMSSTAERRLSTRTVEAVQTAARASIARSVIAGAPISGPASALSRRPRANPTVSEQSVRRQNASSSSGTRLRRRPGCIRARLSAHHSGRRTLLFHRRRHKRSASFQWDRDRTAIRYRLCPGPPCGSAAAHWDFDGCGGPGHGGDSNSLGRMRLAPRKG